MAKKSLISSLETAGVAAGIAAAANALSGKNAAAQAAAGAAPAKKASTAPASPAAAAASKPSNSTANNYASVGSNFHARLFLEGREVPFISAQITCAPGAPMTCALNLVPHETIKNIRPKTQIHLVVKDTLAFPDSNYYLAFEGETSSRGYTKSHDGRGFRISAMDYSVYWDEAKAYYYNANFILGKLGDYASGEPSESLVGKAAGSQNLQTVSSIQGQMIKVMLANSKPDLVNGVVTVLKTMGQGNTYLRAAQARLRITDRIALYSSGQLAQFLQALNIEELMNNFTGQMGGLVSIREMLLQVMQMFFHDFMSVPFPPYYAKSKTMGGYVFVPDTYPIPPPKCNVIFPNSLINFDFDDDFRGAPTRYGFQGSLPEFVGGAVGVTRYPIQFYPQSFWNYMYVKDKKPLGDEAGSLLDSSTLISNYSKLQYQDARTGSTYFGTKLREMDFLTNDEALRGIFYDQETFPPAITALAKNASAAGRTAFIESVGEYLFYKKRYSARNGQASLRFSPYVVPGFNGVILDVSDAGQTIIAKFQSLTHIISNDSALTTVQLGYARDFDEADALSGGTGDPPVPTWFNPAVFGSANKAQYDAETAALQKNKYITTAQAKQRSLAKKPLTYPALSTFYQNLLGCDSITGNNFTAGQYPSTMGAISAIISMYQAKANNQVSRDQFTKKFVSRPIATLGQAMYFIGAAAKGAKTLTNPDANIPSQWASFSAVPGGKFDGTPGLDQNVLALRRKTIDSYILVLKRGVLGGFSG